MKKVITYGTYDLLHYGHIRLLERAKSLGDYLVVGVTADAFDRARGKINVKQPLMQRIEAVKALGIADEIIVEEYEGQKIDDIRRMGIDIFTVGSDWVGQFDYLKDYCEVVYLERTEGVSSSDLRANRNRIKMGIIGEVSFLNKVINESHYVNGLDIVTQGNKSIDQFINDVDAVYIVSHPEDHYNHIRLALENKKHVLVEAPITIDGEQTRELFELADRKGCILMEALKTAYSTAYSRLLLLVKSGKIGQVVSVDATCTSLREQPAEVHSKPWNSMCAWGPVALLPIFQILGTEYKDSTIIQRLDPHNPHFDLFTKIDFLYNNAVASIKVGKGVKSEGELVISGTKGYVYVPAPWWKTDYFEIRYENAENNQRFFYQLDGEGIRYELVAFLNSIASNKDLGYIARKITEAVDQLINKTFLRQIKQI